MKTIKIILAIALGISSISAIAQDIQQYSGSYQKGTATYSYYEREDGTRAMHGKFTAKKDDASQFGSQYTYNIKGQYVDDKRDGQWVIDFKNVANKLTFSGKLTINYKNGLHEGNYSAVIKADGPVDVVPQYNSGMNAGNNCTVLFDCVNNLIEGPVSITINDVVCKGNATNSRPTGIWTETERYLKHTFNCDSKSGYSIDVQTGDRLELEKFPRVSEILDFLYRYVGFYESLTDPNNQYGGTDPKKYSKVELKFY